MKLLVFLLLVLGLAWWAHYFAEESYEERAIKCIVGEASNQSFDTQLCVAHAIRNRGTLRGVYGEHARHNDSEPEEVWQNARDAWDYSAYEKDPVHGAKNFGTKADFFKQKRPITGLKCGDFYFY